MPSNAITLVKAITSILVIEDDPDICDLLAGVREAEFSAAVRCARTGKEALEAIDTGAFDLAIAGTSAGNPHAMPFGICRTRRLQPQVMCIGIVLQAL